MNPIDFGYELNETSYGSGACDPNNDQVWQNKLSLSASLPIFLMQLTIILIVNRLVLLIVKPIFRQPLIFCQIITGVLLGPAGIGNTEPLKIIFPYTTAMTLETFGNIGIVFHIFLVGLEMDLNLVLTSGRKVISIALVGILIPMLVGLGLFFITVGDLKGNDKTGCMFWGIALSSSNLHEVTQILSDLKLHGMDIGRLAFSSSLINDFCTIILLFIAMLLINDGKYYALLSTLVFMLLCVFVVRPALAWMFNFHHNYSSIGDHHTLFLLAGVLLCGFITDACGVHSITGAFMLGVTIPKAHKELNIRSIIKERLNDFMNLIWMPIFFLITGFRSNLRFMFSVTTWKIVSLVIVTSCLVKMMSTFLVSLFLGVPKKDGLALSLLMNTKGVLTLVVLYTGRDMQALNNQTFPLMILALLVMIFMVEPILSVTYKQTKQFIPYKHRTIPKTKQELEFRILVCVHSTNNINGMISLVRFTNATNESPIYVFVVHLMELIEHTASMLIVHDRCRSLESEQFINAFNNYQKTTEGVKVVNVQILTCVSSCETMHNNIYSLAEDERINLIIIPFQLQLTNPNNTALSNMLANAPCSMGVLVDCGNLNWEEKNRVNQISMIMLFIGGPDDREALAYAWRMAGHPNVNLTVVRFLPGMDAAKLGHLEAGDSNDEIPTDYDREKQMDDEDIYEFKFKGMKDDSISYIEKVVNNGEETIATVTLLSEDSCHLFIVGRREGLISPLTEGLSSKKSTSSELGIMGDVLATINLASHASSVLVMQQHKGINSSTSIKDESSIATPNHDSIKYDAEPFLNKKN